MSRIDFSRLRFVVVDDNAHMRRIVRTLLQGFGSREVHEAEDGAAGLEAFNANVPDILITDWATPIFDGLELTQMIRQPGANPNPFVPIIMLTGHSEKRRALYERIVNVVMNPRPFVRTKTYFGPDRRRSANPGYNGPERRRGGHADFITQQSLLGKAQLADPKGPSHG
jgi:two-component system chemotaxis response regulator CheY